MVALQLPAAGARGARLVVESSSTTVEPRAVGIVEPGIPAVAEVVAPKGPSGIIEVPSAYHGAIDNPPPLYRITADTLYDAGLQHGTMANWRIREWFSTSGMTTLFKWVGLAGVGNGTKDGRRIFTKLKEDNAKEFPTYVDEMQGIADGAGVPMDQVWVANLLVELDMNLNMLSNSTDEYATDEHCSDVYAISDGGYANGFAQGHNEDETTLLRKYYYFLSYKLSPDQPGFRNCAGLSYPGTVFGGAPTWNEYGIYATQNTLHLRSLRQDGLACTLVQRRAICEAHTMDEAIAGLADPEWGSGASMNLVDVRGKRMANMEIWENLSHVQEVTEKMGNYSHFNMYKHLNQAVGWQVDAPTPADTSENRQGRLDELPPSRSAADIRQRLSDAAIVRPNPRVLNKATIASLIVNGTTGQLDIWCCGIHPNSGRPPVHSFNLFDFFEGSLTLFMTTTTTTVAPPTTSTAEVVTATTTTSEEIESASTPKGKGKRKSNKEDKYPEEEEGHGKGKGKSQEKETGKGRAARQRERHR